MPTDGTAAAVSVIVPAYNSAAELGECLRAIGAATEAPDEVIVVDDASTDDTAAVAAAAGARVIRAEANGGPAAARNRGAAAARGNVLLFIDSDVAIAPDVVARVRRTLAADAEIAAMFGSYDAQPRAGGVVSRWRNLLHHYVHQHGAREAFTFWAGCGAVRKAAFDAVGGFDPRPAWHFIEDIELGHRLRRAGFRIVLEKAMQATHLKRWTLAGMVRTDLLHRAAPWTRLLRRSGAMPADLNLSVGQRLSVALLALALLCVPLAWRWPFLAAVASAAFAVLIVINRALYAFLYRQRGLAFALACIPLHAVYFLCSGAGFVYGTLTPPEHDPDLR
jgi:GT2 family glycosyltransferase